MSYRPTKSEIVPGLLLASVRFNEVLVLAAPDTLGMVPCEVLARTGTFRVSLNMRDLRWQ